MELNHLEDQPSSEKLKQLHGFQQVIELLRVADPHFREKILRDLILRDRQLAYSLIKKI